MLVNALGAVATAVVLVVIGVTKFAEGAWAVIVLVPLLVWLLVRMNKQYERETDELERDLAAFGPPTVERRSSCCSSTTSTRRPCTRCSTRRPSARSTIAVHLESDPERTPALRHAWHVAGLGEIPLRSSGVAATSGGLAGFIAAYGARTARSS